VPIRGLFVGVYDAAYSWDDEKYVSSSADEQLAYLFFAHFARLVSSLVSISGISCCFISKDDIADSAGR
jgi:hypothetical protein